MGDHTHKKEVMFSYRFMNMQMGKLFNNNKKLSKDAVMSAPNGASDGSGSYRMHQNLCLWICICLV